MLPRTEQLDAVEKWPPTLKPVSSDPPPFFFLLGRSVESDSNPAATLFVLLLDPALIALTTLLIVFAHSLPQAYVVGGAFVFFALAIIYLMGGMKLTVSLASFIYPAYMSCSASKASLTRPRRTADVLVIYSLFGILEGAMGFVMNLIPYKAKIAMFMYLSTRPRWGRRRSTTAPSACT